MKDNLFMIIGDDDKLIQFSLFEILNKIEYDDNNKIIYDMNVNNFMDVIEEASMVSLFSPVKIIVVNNFSLDKINDNEIEYLERYIDSNNKDVYIILISEKVDARKKSYKLFKDNSSSTKQILYIRITTYIISQILTIYFLCIYHPL